MTEHYIVPPSLPYSHPPSRTPYRTPYRTPSRIPSPPRYPTQAHDTWSTGAYCTVPSGANTAVGEEQEEGSRGPRNPDTIRDRRLSGVNASQGTCTPVKCLFNPYLIPI